MGSLWNRIRSARGVDKNKINTINSDKNGIANVDAKTSKTDQTISALTPWNISNSSNLSLKRELTKEFWIRTTLFRVSSQKLNLLGRQISRLPLPMAILQMKFSPKKAAREIYSLLLQAQSRINKLSPENGQITDPTKFIIQQALVGNGPYLKRIDIKGRGRHGLIWRPHSFMRLQVAIPDEDATLRKRFKVKIWKENKPAMVRLDY